MCSVPDLAPPLQRVGGGGRLFKGDTIQFRCNGEDQALEGSSELRCKKDGQLSGPLPTCRSESPNDVNFSVNLFVCMFVCIILHTPSQGQIWPCDFSFNFFSASHPERPPPSLFPLSKI